ncbi:MAG TPA: MerR family DNA-binding protein [Sphingobacteriaceae bacterium]
MLISELSKKTGFSRDTIRYYEKQGLISVGRNDRRFNNYKEYSHDILKRLMTIRLIKGFGFTLKEISDLLDLVENNQASCDQVAEKAHEKIKLINAKIQELNNLKNLLNQSVDGCLSSSGKPPASVDCQLLKVTDDQLADKLN